MFASAYVDKKVKHGHVRRASEAMLHHRCRAMLTSIKPRRGQEAFARVGFVACPRLASVRLAAATGAQLPPLAAQQFSVR